MDEQDQGEGTERGKGGSSERQRTEKSREVPKNQQQKWELWQGTLVRRGCHGWKEYRKLETIGIDHSGQSRGGKGPLVTSERATWMSLAPVG